MSYNFDRTRDCMIKALINDEKFVKQYMDKLGETIDEIDKEIQRLIDINNNQIQMEDLKVKFELLQLEKKLQEIQNTLDCLSTFNHKLSYNAFAPLNSVLLVEGKFVNTNNIHVKSDEYVLEMSQNDAINFIKQKKQSILKSI